MNYLDSVIKETGETEGRWKERIQILKEKLRKKHPKSKIVVIVLVDTAHLYEEVKK